MVIFRFSLIWKKIKLQRKELNKEKPTTKNGI